MSKTNSQLLCELAGIAAKHLFSDISDNFEGGFTAFSDILEADLSNGSWMQITKEPVHPNFETPGNFVKLLECGFKCGYALHTDKFNRTKSFVENVLEATIYVLGNDCRGDFKQALQAQDFKY